MAKSKIKLKPKQKKNKKDKITPFLFPVIAGLVSIFSFLVINFMPEVKAPGFLNLNKFSRKPTVKGAQDKKIYSSPAPVRLATAEMPPAIFAKSAFVLDLKSGQALYQKDANQKLPIASLTKLMTALVFLDTGPRWDDEIVMTEDDAVEGGKIYVSTGEKVKVRDLFYASLVGSANNATLALARATGLERGEFVKRMNDLAKSLKMQNTVFTDPTGLEPTNVSTAADLAKLADFAFRHSLISEATTTKEYKFTTVNFKTVHDIKNTNELLTSNLEILGGKTGYLEEAGYPFINKIKGPGAKEIIIVLLGSSSNKERVAETTNLSKWIFSSFQWL